MFIHDSCLARLHGKEGYQIAAKGQAGCCFRSGFAARALEIELGESRAPNSNSSTQAAITTTWPSKAMPRRIGEVGDLAMQWDKIFH